MWTYNGDANLSGNVDADDYFAIDSHYNRGTNIPANDAVKSWHNGDFNYDGEIDGDDFALIDMGFSGQGLPIAPGAVAGGEVAGGVTAVPEPTALFLLPMIGAGLAARRRRAK
jgi:hypothetical protein